MTWGVLQDDLGVLQDDLGGITGKLGGGLQDNLGYITK